MMEAFEPMLCNTGTVNLNPATSSDLENCRLTLEHALHTGYLTQGQYQARLMWLSAATTVGELESLTADLPSHVWTLEEVIAPEPPPPLMFPTPEPAPSELLNKYRDEALAADEETED